MIPGELTRLLYSKSLRGVCVLNDNQTVAFITNHIGIWDQKQIGLIISSIICNNDNFVYVITPSAIGWCVTNVVTPHPVLPID